MKIKCADTGKRFNREWIFRNFNVEFQAGGKYAITGANGSGKSTLLQVIAGAIMSSEGKVHYSNTSTTSIEVDHVYKFISIAAPYLDLIEEMTLEEFLSFHQAFKPFLPGIGGTDIIATTGLQSAAKKQIRYYSSGMKQRVKLAQAIFSNTPCLFLDEPCTNLDEAGIQLYQQLIDTYCNNRLVIVSSNDKQEYGFCSEKIDITDYKNKVPQLPA
ncbi:MAG: ATP-binding cassette domain-containing protein [Chitinophagaceae bacterium]|nr:ATP-binding cassette domain-containing protein [Chitinophagaceae bacterium]